MNIHGLKQRKKEVSKSIRSEKSKNWNRQNHDKIRKLETARNRISRQIKNLKLERERRRNKR